MISIFGYLKDRIQGKAPKGARRSKKWPAVRKKYIAKNPICEICGGKKKLQVHHKIPFHLAPEIELDENNLMTLCEDRKYGIKCHQAIGHLGDYRCFNFSIEQNAGLFRALFLERKLQMGQNIKK